MMRVEPISIEAVNSPTTTNTSTAAASTTSTFGNLDDYDYLSDADCTLCADTKNKNVYVKGLKRDSSREEVDRLFGTFGEIEESRFYSLKGTALVQFSTRKAAERAIAECHGLKTHSVIAAGQALRVRFAYRRKPSPKGPAATPKSPVLPPVPTKDNNNKVQQTDPPITYPMMESDLKNIYIRGLRPDLDDNGLRKMFGVFGTIDNCKFCGGSKGVALVRFSKKEEASAAITTMNGMTSKDDPRVSLRTDELIVKLAHSRSRRRHQALQAENSRRVRPAGSHHDSEASITNFSITAPTEHAGLLKHTSGIHRSNVTGGLVHSSSSMAASHPPMFGMLPAAAVDAYGRVSGMVYTLPPQPAPLEASQTYPHMRVASHPPATMVHERSLPMTSRAGVLEADEWAGHHHAVYQPTHSHTHHVHHHHYAPPSAAATAAGLSHRDERVSVYRPHYHYDEAGQPYAETLAPPGPRVPSRVWMNGRWIPNMARHVVSTPPRRKTVPEYHPKMSPQRGPYIAETEGSTVNQSGFFMDSSDIHFSTTMASTIGSVSDNPYMDRLIGSPGSGETPASGATGERRAVTKYLNVLRFKKLPSQEDGSARDYFGEKDLQLICCDYGKLTFTRLFPDGRAFVGFNRKEDAALALHYLNNTILPQHSNQGGPVQVKYANSDTFHPLILRKAFAKEEFFVESSKCGVENLDELNNVVDKFDPLYSDGPPIADEYAFAYQKQELQSFERIMSQRKGMIEEKSAKNQQMMGMAMQSTQPQFNFAHSRSYTTSTSASASPSGSEAIQIRLSY